MAKRAPLPDFVEPQLAKLVKTAPDGDGWLHELKYDGYRILARLEKGQVRLMSRRGNDWTEPMSAVAAAVARLPVTTALLDGEVAVVRADGTTSFQDLQSRGDKPLTYFVFDLLHLDGEDVARAPLVDRKARLAALIAEADAGAAAIIKYAPSPPIAIIKYADHVEGHGAAFFEAASRRGLEGIISKLRDAPYQSGRRGGWLKTKCIQRQELVIAGFTDPEGARSGLGALLVGYYEGEALRFAGKVGTGFGQRMLGELRAQLGRRERATSPFEVKPSPALTGKGVHWVEPALVAEVAFTEWTSDGRLRHPSFQGLRADKDPREVVRETPTSAPPAPVAKKTSGRSRSRTRA